MDQALFQDLDEEIIADDWLVPREEISKRRLIKQTPRYNIYKADWFGDVLVYEPAASGSKVSNRRRTGSGGVPSSSEADKSRAEELRLRLASLDLDMKRVGDRSIQIKKPQGSIADSERDVDSAYSSISSTPNFSSKKVKSEFEFPHLAPSMMAPSDECEGKQLKHPEKTPVILNKDSYISSDEVQRPSSSDGDTTAISSSIRSGGWQELNELRLIAHESFMLFMGASVDEMMDTNQAADTCNGLNSSTSSTSLVMQMNHPKAVSLRNLLRQTPPSNRLPTTVRQHYGEFGCVAKLNICQQIRDAMTYLHGKNIVHGRLTSVNIYIEPNQCVKISLIDHDEQPIATINSAHDDKVEFNASALNYLSPELIRTLRVIPRQPVSGAGTSGQTTALVQINTNHLTKKSDIFSFGTIVYEMFHERLPYSGVSAAEVIYRIGSGQMRDAASGCPALVQRTISACWSANPWERPDFKHLRFDVDQ